MWYNNITSTYNNYNNEKIQQNIIYVDEIDVKLIHMHNSFIPDSIKITYQPVQK